MSKLVIAAMIAFAVAAAALALPRIGDAPMQPRVTATPGWSVSTCHC